MISRTKTESGKGRPQSRKIVKRVPLDHVKHIDIWSMDTLEI